MKRPLSWTAIIDGYFLKIARRSDDPARDAADPDACAEIDAEYRATELLARLSDRVPPPVAHLPGCLIKHAIDAVEFRDELLEARGEDGVNRSLAEAVELCAELHLGSIGGAVELTEYNYGADPFFPAAPAIVDRARSRPMAVVCRGFEVRNLMRDRATRRIVFFDPHAVALGMPEEDVARFVVSVLMVRWSRQRISLPWTEFSAKSLVEVYCRGGLSLDPLLLDYAMRNALAMRRHFAMQSVASMSLAARALGRAYVRFYFSQIDRWRQLHGF